MEHGLEHRRRRQWHSGRRLNGVPRRARQGSNPQTSSSEDWRSIQLSYGRETSRGRQTIPAELPGRSSAVAVRAPNGAFGDFGLHCTPTPRVFDHGCNVERLGRWIDMVEIQDHWIVLAAINTWVRL